MHKAMPLVYDVGIEPAEQAGLFFITWKDVKKGTVNRFQQILPEIQNDNLELWRLSLHHLDIGEKLFHFLNGESGHFKKALNRAEQKATTLHINLRTSGKITDWPFECLASNGEFLLHRRLHLVRQIAPINLGRATPVRNGALKLLFMACSAIDVHPELDFDREEEEIFRITEKLAMDVDIEDSGSIAGLRNRLKSEKYDVIYLSGFAGIDEQHGPYFVMEDEFGYECRVDPGQLWKEALMENPPRLLFLSGSNTGKSPVNSACTGIPGNADDGSFARLMSEPGRVPAVLGWGHLMIDAPAICAFKMLLRELTRGRSILDAVQRVRYELMKEFPGRGQGSWVFLRLYGDGATMNALVKSDQNWRPGPRRMKHTYLKNSRVRVLSEGFIGRRRQVQACLRILKNDSLKTGVLITGAGGIGKSCLAGKLSERFPNHTIITVHGRLNSISLEDALKDAFFISQDETAKKVLELPIGMIEKLQTLCASSFKNKNYLILLDDFEQNLDNANKGEPGFLLPEGRNLLTGLLLNLPFSAKQTQLIITCRYDFSLFYQDIDLVKIHLDKIAIPSFSQAENQKKVRALRNIFNYKSQEPLIDAGCGNPRLLEWLDKLVETGKDGDIHLLLDKVKYKKEEFIEAHVLRELIAYGGNELMNFLRSVGIYRRPIAVQGIRQMAEGLGISCWQSLLQKGVELSLVEFDQLSERYIVSALVQDILLPVDGDYSMFHRFAYDYYRELCDGRDNLDARMAEEWIYHALGCGREDTAVLQGARLVACMHRRLALQVAFDLGEWILSMKKIKPHTEFDAFLFNEVAGSAFSLGEFRKSIQYYRDTLAIDCELYGEEHPETALDLSNMGLALVEIKEYNDAIFSFQKALAIYKKIYGPAHAGVAQVLNNLGSVFFNQGKFQDALGFFEQALSIDLKVHGDLHPQYAISLNNVGEALIRLDFHEKAIDYLLSALSVNRKVYGEEHPIVARDLINIGSAYYLLGKFTTAVDYLNQAYVIIRTCHGRYHVSLAVVLNSLGLAMHALKNYDKAIEYFEEALSIQHKVYGEEHPLVGVTLNNLGEVWRNKGDLLKAADLYNHGLEMEIKAYGEKHPDVAILLNSIGLVNYDRGYLSEAMSYFKRSLAIDKSVYGKEHTSIAGDYYNMAQVYELLRKKEKAKTYFKKAYTMFLKFLPEGHPSIISAQQKLREATSASSPEGSMDIL